MLSELSSHPGQQFGEGKRLNKVIISARLKTFDAILNRVARRQANNRGLMRSA